MKPTTLSHYRTGRRVVCPRCNLRGEFQKYTDGSAAILHYWYGRAFREVIESCVFPVWPPEKEVPS